MNNALLLGGKRWLPGVTRNSSVFHSILVGEGDLCTEKCWHMPTKDLLYITLDGKHQAAFFSEEKLKEYEKALDKLFSSPKKLAWVKLRYTLYGDSLRKSSNSLENNLTLQNFKSFLKDYAILTNGLWITAMAGRHFHKLLLEALKHEFPNYTNQQRDALVGTLTYPPHSTPLMQSQISLLKLGVATQAKKPNIFLEKLLEKHLNTYKVIPVNYNEDPWTKQDILKQLKLLLKGNCQKELSAYQLSHKQKVKAAALALKSLTNAKARHYAQILQAVTLLNEYRKFVFCHASFAHQEIFRRIARMYKLKQWRECFKLTPAEIMQLYFFKNATPLKQLPKRKVVAVLFDRTAKNNKFFSKKEVQAFLNAMNPQKSATKIQETVLTGNVANPGLVRGKAKIILNTQDFHKFKPGNILIAPMTSVDFVPLMKQAAAFVTNEGGITSHASIVSREMNKPCIIGTKIATKVFKDGDMVEVNANKGIVRKL